MRHRTVILLDNQRHEDWPDGVSRICEIARIECYNPEPCSLQRDAMCVFQADGGLRGPLQDLVVLQAPPGSNHILVHFG